MIRRERLNLFVSMRSNDAFKGLPHDVFAFTMLQEIVARDLGVGVGRYKQAVASLHLYAENIDAAKAYLDEGWQSTAPMPSMQLGSPWDDIGVVLTAEQEIRNGVATDVGTLPIHDYWKDVLRLLQIYSLTRKGAPLVNLRNVVTLKRSMSSTYFDQYIRSREKKLTTYSEQLALDLPADQPKG